MISKLIKINNTNILRKAYQAASTLATSDMSRVSEICDLSQKHAIMWTRFQLKFLNLQDNATNMLIRLLLVFSRGIVQKYTHSDYLQEPTVN